MTIRYKQPDVKNAFSIIEAAARDMKFTLSLPATEESAATIARNIYESFRMLGDALLVAKGIRSEDHILPINELMQLRAKTARPLGLLDNLRRTRHNINYYGYKPSLPETKDIVNFAQSCFEPVKEAVLREIQTS